jgi:hypothetical protein
VRSQHRPDGEDVEGAGVKVGRHRGTRAVVLEVAVGSGADRVGLCPLWQLEEGTAMMAHGYVDAAG